MIIKTINPGVYHMSITIREVIYGNDSLDILNNWTHEATLLKLRGDGCTVMVFGEKNMTLFKKIPLIGHNLNILVHQGKFDNVYVFKGFIK